MMSDIEDLYIKAAYNGNVEQLKDIDKKHRVDLGTVMNALQISVGEYKTFRYLSETHRNSVPPPMLKAMLDGVVECMTMDENIDGLKWAISRGGDPSASHAFANAVKSGNIEIIDILLSVRLHHEYITTVAFYALQMENQAVVDHLMTDRLYQNRRPHTLSLAAAAAYHNDAELLRRVVDTYNVDVTAENNALFKHLISSSASLDIYEYLEEKGASPEDKLNELLISCITRRAHLLFKHFLKKYDVDPDFKPNADTTLLHHASECSPQSCETLIQLGADPHILDSDKKTPIFNAIASKKSTILDVFLKAGGHLSPCKPEEFASTLDVALEEKWQEGVEKIRQANTVFTKQIEYIAKIDFSALKTMDDFRQVQIEREPSSTGGFGIKASGLVAALFSEDTDAFFEKLAGFGPGCLKPEDADLSVRVDNGHTSFKADLTDIILEKKVVSKLFDERLWTAKPAEMTEFFDALPKKLQDQAQDEYKRSLSSLRLKNKVASNPGHKLKLRRRSPGR
jgi:ankyrin repeat protein